MYSTPNGLECHRNVADIFMSKYWRIAFAQFSKDHTNSAKIKSKGRRSKKYQATCFQLKGELRRPLDDDIFEKAFELAMT